MKSVLHQNLKNLTKFSGGVLRLNPSTFKRHTLPSVITCRCYNHNNSDRIIPELMEFPQLYTPKITNTIRNRFLAATLIRPYFDKDFTIGQFCSGAKLAAHQVSQSLATGDLSDIEDSLTPSCFSTVSRNLSLFSMKQRAELDLQLDDISNHYLYQIGIMMDDQPDEFGNYGRQVECTWVAQAFKDFLSLVDECGGNPMDVKRAMDAQGGLTVLNFRFIRDYSKNVEDSWTINALNYYKVLQP
eukprot:TRINITY_DN3991_c0_g1_i18.p1 TRINITY_DN3991_c0_g1~~TRINITY_DN3991_c0_g1_i18.p1  ORF type:complete len:243 (-),score=20.67 TRINITY_DN3991_c0_g1_i18:753-1481(-)